MLKNWNFRFSLDRETKVAVLHHPDHMGREEAQERRSPSPTRSWLRRRSH